MFLERAPWLAATPAASTQKVASLAVNGALPYWKRAAWQIFDCILQGKHWSPMMKDLILNVYDC
jgi:hypothetical protein